MSRSVAIVTVTYNGGDTPLAWADAIQRAGPTMAIAVDNASPEGTAGRLAAYAPWVRVIAQSRNRGFAAGCNIGIAAAGEAELIVLLNPDITVAPPFLATLETLDWPDDVAAIGPCVLGADGSVEQSARRFPRLSTGLWGRTTLLTRLFPAAARRRQLLAEPTRGRRDVDWISGACMVIPRRVLERVGPLDERYFMYWEDADWCTRAHAAGLRVVYDPALQVRHTPGSSAASRPIATTIAFHRSAYRYYATHVASRRVACALAALVLALRCTLKLGAALIARARPPRP